MALTSLVQLGTFACWISDGGLVLKSELMLDIPKLAAAWLRVTFLQNYKYATATVSLCKFAP